MAEFCKFIIVFIIAYSPLYMHPWIHHYLTWKGGLQNWARKLPKVHLGNKPFLFASNSCIFTKFYSSTLSSIKKGSLLPQMNKWGSTKSDHLPKCNLGACGFVVVVEHRPSFYRISTLHSKLDRSPPMLFDKFLLRIHVC